MLLLLTLLLLLKKKQMKRTQQQQQQQPEATRTGCSDGGGDVDNVVAAAVGTDRLTWSCHYRPVDAAFAASGSGNVEHRCFRSGQEDLFLRTERRLR